VIGLTEGLDREYLRILFLRRAAPSLGSDIRKDAEVMAFALEQPAARAHALTTLAGLANESGTSLKRSGTSTPLRTAVNGWST
jgi:hypothetical protein